MFILDGGPDSELPTGSGGPVLAGRGAIFVAGRVAADASTVVRIGTSVGHGDLVLAYEGDLETPDSELRLLNILGDVLAVVSVCSPVTRITIYLSDLAEPDEVLVTATLV